MSKFKECDLVEVVSVKRQEEEMENWAKLDKLKIGQIHMVSRAEDGCFELVHCDHFKNSRYSFWHNPKNFKLIKRLIK